MTHSVIDTAVLDLVGKGETVLFIGAGFSLIPSDKQSRDRKGLREFLIEKYEVTLKQSHLDYTSLSMEDIVFHLRVQGISKRAIAETLRGFLASNEELAKLQSFTLLRSLLTLRPNLFEAVITTNWDRGIEESLRSIPNLRVKRLVRDEDCLDYNPSKLSVLKIHGDIEDSDSIILSSQDFDVYEKEHPLIIERLRVLFSTKYIIFLGFAVRDDNFRRIFRSLSYDLGIRMRGGWIVAPSLGDRERLWAPTVNLRPVNATAQSFLSTALSYVAKVPLGVSGSIPRYKLHDTRFDGDSELSKLARRIKQRYHMREVWVAKLRDMERPNRGIGQVAAYYIESCCRAAKSLAISTGETMDVLASTLDTTAFRSHITIMPTIVLLAGPRGFNDPSHVAQKLVSRFPRGKAEGVPLRLPDEEYLSHLFPKQSAKHRNSLIQVIRSIGLAQVAKAMKSDVIISSVRPCNWLGGKDMPPVRTIPIQWVSGIPADKLNFSLHRAGVVAITQMILLNQKGRDVLSTPHTDPALNQLNRLICRPSVEQLKKAARSSRKVIVAASHIEELPSILAILNAKLCNALILDESLAKALLESINNE